MDFDGPGNWRHGWQIVLLLCYYCFQLLQLTYATSLYFVQSVKDRMERYETEGNVSLCGCVFVL